jgi:hypothetical protein
MTADWLVVDRLIFLIGCWYTCLQDRGRVLPATQQTRPQVHLTEFATRVVL